MKVFRHIYETFVFIFLTPCRLEILDLFYFFVRKITGHPACFIEKKKKVNTSSISELPMLSRDPSLHVLCDLLGILCNGKKKLIYKLYPSRPSDRSHTLLAFSKSPSVVVGELQGLRGRPSSSSLVSPLPLLKRSLSLNSVWNCEKHTSGFGCTSHFPLKLTPHGARKNGSLSAPTRLDSRQTVFA